MLQKYSENQDTVGVDKEFRDQDYHDIAAELIPELKKYFLEG